MGSVGLNFHLKNPRSALMSAKIGSAVKSPGALRGNTFLSHHIYPNLTGLPSIDTIADKQIERR